jgi:mono/diheme cytochrome c family protein
MRSAIAVLVVSLVLAGAAPSMGGWAVITVRDLPERLVVGEPTEITFRMLQHGERPLTGRSPSVYIKGEGGSVLASMRRPAARETSAGVYTATVTPSRPGAAEIVIDGDWHEAKVTLLPIRVTRAGERVAAQPVHERGRQLFVAKGCQTCHVKRDEPGAARGIQVAAGPELTGRTFPDEWLSRKLENPARDRIRANDWMVMPDLGLRAAEVAALTSYINRPAVSAGISSGAR